MCHLHVPFRCDKHASNMLARHKSYLEMLGHLHWICICQPLGHVELQLQSMLCCEPANVSGSCGILKAGEGPEHHCRSCPTCRFWAQQDLVSLLREEPRWTSGLLRRWQQLHFSNLKHFSRFGAPTSERLGAPLSGAKSDIPKSIFSSYMSLSHQDSLLR